MKAVLLSLTVVCASLLGATPAVADTPHGNFELRLEGRYDFHTWIWALASCDGDCVRVQAIPQPIARHSRMQVTRAWQTAGTPSPSMSPTDYAAATSITGRRYPPTTCIPGTRPHASAY